MDRLIAGGLSLIVLSLITVTFGGGVICGYRGILLVIGGHASAAAIRFLSCTLLSAAAFLLMRHKDDLMDRE